jgi:hypothetical protein
LESFLKEDPIADALSRAFLLLNELSYEPDRLNDISASTFILNYLLIIYSAINVRKKPS